MLLSLNRWFHPSLSTSFLLRKWVWHPRKLSVRGFISIEGKWARMNWAMITIEKLLEYLNLKIANKNHLYFKFNGFSFVFEINLPLLTLWSLMPILNETRWNRVVPNIFYVLIIVQIKISARHHQKGAVLMRCALYANESIFGLLRNPQSNFFFHPLRVWPILAPAFVFNYMVTIWS